MTLPKPFDAGAHAVRTERDVIRATGPDTGSFLQGQLSQDVQSLAVGDSAYSFLLQPQGKVSAWLRVARLAEESFLLDLDANFGEAALERLGRFKLRTKCDLALHRWEMVSVRAPAGAESIVEAGYSAEAVLAARWPGVEGVDLIGPEVSWPANLPEATLEDLETLRIDAGIPAMGAELTEATIPNETGVVAQSVSFTKGCFTGQELVARIDSRGANVARHLRRLVVGGAVQVGDAVAVNGAEVGTISSVSGGVALAYIRRSVESLPADALVGGAPASVLQHPANEQVSG